MSDEIINMMKQIEKVKNLDEQELIRAFERGIISATKKVYGVKPIIRVEYREGEIKFFWKKKVVENVSNEYTEISLDEARQIKSDIQIGEDIETIFYPKEFGRIAAQTTKQVLTQKIKEVEKEQIFKDFKEKEGEIITGVVHTIEKDNLIIDFGLAEGILRKKEQVRTEKFGIGDNFRALVLKVFKSKDGAKLELTRTHPDFIKKIFAMEVTEIDQGIVEIKYVAREPGIKTKVVVASKDKQIDPVGACIGIKGSRIQTIIKELQGERVDVVLYSDDIVKYLESAIAPIRIKKIYVDNEHRYAILGVPDEQFSQVIGKGGINMRLVAKITKWKVSVLRESEFTDEKIAEMMEKFNEQLFYDLFKLSEILNIKILKELKKNGIKNLKDFIAARNEELAQIINTDENKIKELKDKTIQIIEKGSKTKNEDS